MSANSYYFHTIGLQIKHAINFSLIKCMSASTCLILSCWTGLCAMLMATLMSQHAIVSQALKSISALNPATVTVSCYAKKIRFHEQRHRRTVTRGWPAINHKPGILHLYRIKLVITIPYQRKDHLNSHLVKHGRCMHKLTHHITSIWYLKSSLWQVDSYSH